MLIASICRNDKHGLLDHVSALQDFGSKLDCSNCYMESLSWSDIRVLARNRITNNVPVLVITWDNSIRSLAKVLMCRLLGFQTAYFFHEPGGLEQKLKKGDSVVYSVSVVLAESLFQKICRFTLVARESLASYGDFVCPLLYVPERPPKRTAQSPKIGFLGRKRASRCYDLFLEVASLLKERGYTIKFFPAADTGKSKEDKFAFLSECTFVWNLYAVPYNQSGVTGDCIMSDVPVIHSQYEPFLALLNHLGLSVLIESCKPPEQIAEIIIAHYEKVGLDATRRPCDTDRAQLRSDFGGAGAFLNYWLPAIRTMSESISRH